MPFLFLAVLFAPDTYVRFPRVHLPLLPCYVGSLLGPRVHPKLKLDMCPMHRPSRPGPSFPIYTILHNKRYSQGKIYILVAFLSSFSFAGSILVGFSAARSVTSTMKTSLTCPCIGFFSIRTLSVDGVISPGPPEKGKLSQRVQVVLQYKELVTMALA